MQVGAKIRKIRELQGLKQEAMASQLGIHQTTYSRLENEKNKITIETLKKIAAIFGVGPMDILNFDEKFFTNMQAHKGSQSGSLGTAHLSEKVQTFYETRIKSLEGEAAFLKALLGEAEH